MESLTALIKHRWIGYITPLDPSPQTLAQAALSIFADHATRLLGEHHGYLVEMTGSGLCLAAFASPLQAIMWGVMLIEALKGVDWDSDLLAHEVGVDKANPHG